MNWNAITFDWNQVRAFLVTAEEGTFSAAARKIGLTQPTLSRQVAALEQKLGLVLFERTKHSLTLTGSGRELLTHARQMGGAAINFSFAATGQAKALEGRVIIAATDGVAAGLLPPILAKIRQAAPRIKIEIQTSIEKTDLTRREADIAIRHSEDRQPNLISKPIGSVTAMLCASPDYLASFGPVRNLSDLSKAQFIGLGPQDDYIAWLNSLGLSLTTDNFSVGASSGVVITELVRSAMGIAIMPYDQKLSPDIVTILPDKFSIPVPIWLVSHRELQTSQRIRTVFDFLASELENVTQAFIE